MINSLSKEVDRLDALLRAKCACEASTGQKNKELYDFDSSKISYYDSEIELLVKKIRKGSSSFNDANLSNLVKEMEKLYVLRNIDGLLKKIKQIKELTEYIAPKSARLDIKAPLLQYEIRDEISADLSEIEKCYAVGSYRSTTILCGRILETALHRKYYEVTGKDILETEPGIGLGKLIARLKEKKVVFDPGITEQIHLINQIRVFSVHKKSKLFSPSEQQAHAIVLYTLDVLKKLFDRKNK